LFEAALAKGEGKVASNGAFCAVTAPRTGRSPKDKFVVRGPVSERLIDWSTNQAMEPEQFDALFARFADYVHDRECYVFNGYAGADPDHRLGVRIVTEFAWHNLFVHQMFLRLTRDEFKQHKPEFRVICMPGLKCDPKRDGTRSEACIVLNFEKRIVLIGGTRYAGEMKKSIFTVMNYFMPQHGVLPMHCSANVGDQGDVALFFGLSGTGKTTLSADPKRKLIGDDEHGWGKNGVFNFEGGCYAKCINLTREKEPEIFDAIRFGAVLENVILEDDHDPDYFDNAITENTRVAYPIDYIPNAVIPGVAGHPNKVIFLTADATGVLPPVSRLTESQAMYHFLSGYTSKLAGTETGVTEPQAAFSACFGAPFLPLPPSRYAEMLGQKLREHKATCYLVNTGWSGGAYGTGQRIKLAHTRAIIDAVLNGELDKATVTEDPVFRLHVPTQVTGVPAEILQPRNSWADKAGYDQAAKQLAERFRKNFERFAGTADEIQKAGPA
jgi:phosphoenolpyruvate carboxykinase (ATP)